MTATKTRPESIHNADGTTTSAYVCNFCLEDRHEKCYRALVNGDKGVYLCPCAKPGCGGKILSCIICKKVHDDVTPDTRQCVDRDSCEARLQAARDANPIYRNITRIQENSIMAKTETAKVEREKKAKTGVCKCGCEGTTKGGNFLPGHDARFVSEQVSFVVSKSKTKAVARKEIAAISDNLAAKFDKSVALAEEKAVKAAAAEKERQAAAKEKAAAKKSGKKVEAAAAAE